MGLQDAWPDKGASPAGSSELGHAQLKGVVSSCSLQLSAEVPAHITHREGEI